MLLQTGRVSSLVALLFMTFVMLYCMKLSRRQLPSIRRISGLDAIEEAIGRATEMDRPVFYTTGTADITASYAANIFAGLEILGYTARIVARNDARISVGISMANVYPLALRVVEEAYLQAGRPDAFRSSPNPSVKSGLGHAVAASFAVDSAKRRSACRCRSRASM